MFFNVSRVENEKLTLELVKYGVFCALTMYTLVS